MCMKAKIQRYFKTLKFNSSTLILFELIYKLLTVLIFVPLFWQMFYGIFRLEGMESLTADNFTRLLTNPLTYLLLALLVLLIAILSLVDICGVIYILNQAWHRKKASLLLTFRAAFQDALRVWQKKNLLMILMILFMLPFLHLSSATSMISVITLPEFFGEYVQSKPGLALAFLGLFIFLGILLIRWLYAIHYYTLEDINFKEARKKSIQLGKGHRIKDLLSIVLLQILCYLVFIGLALLGVLIIVVIWRLFAARLLLRAVFSSAISVFLLVLFFVFEAFVMPVCYGAISILFYHNKEKKGEPIPDAQEYAPRHYPRLKKLFSIVLVCAISLAVVIVSTYAYRISTGALSLEVIHERTTEICAHRGNSTACPENTMAAFRSAIEAGADCIELDVQMSKDGQLFVMHDTNFSRTTGLNKNSWELTYDEIAQLDAGSYFGQAYAGEKIPLLSDVIQLAREYNIFLDIEVKPTGHENGNLAKSVTDLIYTYNFSGSCVICSKSYAILTQIKKLDPDIKTAYITTIAFGDFGDLSNADAFSIETTNLTAEKVRAIHEAGKDVYAWTVNSRTNIFKMLELDVDQLITDKVVYAKECLEDSKSTNLIMDFIEKLMTLFPSYSYTS